LTHLAGDFAREAQHRPHSDHPRRQPAALLDLLRPKLVGEPVDQAALDARLAEAVDDIVREHVEVGIDVIDDGEQSKSGFANYVRDRLGGFEARPSEHAPFMGDNPEVKAFPEYYAGYFKTLLADRIAPTPRMVCVGPVTYTGQAQLQRDLANLRHAAEANGVVPEDVFVPASPGRNVGRNEFYATTEEFQLAVIEARRVEYQAIIDAGFLLQLDDPAIASSWGQDRELPLAERRKNAHKTVELTNHALRGLPEERIRYHCCYGINHHGPRVYDEPLTDYLPVMLQISAGAYSFESANPRHAWSYHACEDVKLPDGKAIIPGCVSHAINIVEHPLFIADLIENYARLVGRENVIAGGDCEFSLQATYTPEVHPTVVWAKLAALSEGARLASERLWARRTRAVGAV
jgi:5-methyltetrahydropteroyltriglutamate--homocysteine methyltransferase